MSKPNDGGPAYPVSGRNFGYVEDGREDIPYGEGMSLRDRFAMMELPVDAAGDWLGWSIGDAIVSAFGNFPPGHDPARLQWLADVEARIRYMRADAMLRERERNATQNEAY